MTAQILLGLLKNVRQVAPQRWTARCPAHDDHSPSLSINEKDDGRMLIHCFAGCSSYAVVESLGLTVADLFPEPISHHCKPARANHWHAAREALRILYREVIFVAIAGENIAAGIQLSPDDLERVALAAQRIRACAEVCA